ncbi:MFS general substrate transporter [Pyrenochaeta sp. DS3sAY3a]|nr:MFS general substrate transporter [Pyrenochaeta sp. DS3sAY3a]
MATEKMSNTLQIEQAPSTQDDENLKDDSKINTDEQGFTADVENMPKGYYLSSFFLGTCCAVGFGAWAGNAGFAYAAPLLSTINADLGPDPNIQWVALIHPVGLSVGMTIVGRLSDIFGRRYFFICGAFLAMLGTLISGLAVNVDMLICGSMIKALAASTQLSCYYTIGELIPSKYRYLMIGAINVWNLPGQGFAPVVAQSLARTRVGWRAVFFLLTAVNGASLICYCIFYYPPNFHQKHGMKEKKMEWVKHFDYIGTLLYAAGLTMFLLGLSWGGAKYPWKSPEVLSFIIIGFSCLVAFACWECFVPLREPLVPLSLFRNRHWVVSAILTGIGAGVYFSGAIIWPQITQNFYANGDPMHAAFLSCLSNLGILIGGFTGGCLAKPIGHQKLQITVAMAVGGALLASVSTATPQNQNQSAALFFFAAFFMGYVADIALGNAIITITDQREIGAAGGASASVRTAVAGTCQAVYNVVLSNRRAKTVPAAVVPAVLAAGLPRNSTASILAALSLGTPGAWSAVGGLTPAIRATAIQAYQSGLAEAFKTVWFTSLAFTGLGVCLSLLSPNTEKLLTGKVAVSLAARKPKENSSA